MFIKRRQIKNKRKKNRLIEFIFLFSLALFIISFLGFLYLSLFYKPSIIVPLSENNTSQLSNIEGVLQKSQIDFAQVTLNPDNSINIILKDGGDVILSSKKDLRAQVSSLQLILSRLTIEGKKLKVLDFRYNSPVLSF